MANIIPISTGRTSNTLVSQRLLAQIQFDQTELLKAQEQISTGRRISAPSEDPAAAIRAMSLQRLVEQKEQVGVNLTTSRSYVAASENAIASAAGLLNDLRGSIVSVADSTSTELARQSASAEVRRTIDQLLDMSNQRFRDRYLFGGSKTTQAAFEQVGSDIRYTGNETSLYSLADIDLTFESNITGHEVFGGLSPEVRGSADLAPLLSLDTRLDDLRGGRGISPGSIAVTDGNQESIIDLSRAETLRDVVGLIEAQPPAGRTVTVRVEDHGLSLALDAAGGGDLSVREVGSGVTAAQLGLRKSTGGGPGPIPGDPLEPLLKLTTPLSNILGTRAKALVATAGVSNDLIFEQQDRGAEGNGWTVQFVDDNLLQATPGLQAGHEAAELATSPRAASASLALSGPANDLILTATAPGISGNNIRVVLDDSADLGDDATVDYDADSRTLTLGIDDSDETTLATLVDRINTHGLFTAAADPSAGETYDGAAAVASTNAGSATANTGNSGAAANTLLVRIHAGQTTAAQVAAAVNGNPTTAAVFSVRSDVKDQTPGVVAGASVVDVNATAVTAGGSGIEFDQSHGLEIVNGGETHVIDLSSAETVEDLLNILNGSDAQVVARINSHGAGIDVRSRLSGSDFAIGEHGGATATHLGIRSFARETELADLNFGRGVHTVEGPEVIIRRDDGVNLEIDLTDARTIGDVLDRINQHPDNLDPHTAVTARLAEFGNGIELIDNNPIPSGARLTVARGSLSEAVWDLGLVPAGQNEATAAEGTAAVSGTIAFGAPPQPNTAFRVEAPAGGTGPNGASVLIVGDQVGNVATASFNPTANVITVHTDPTATTTAAIVQAINQDTDFTATLDVSGDPTNDGSAVFGDVGTVGSLVGGTPDRLTGTDVNPLEVEGVFNTLKRLDDALIRNDLREMTRTLELLDADANRFTFARADLGAREQGLDVLEQRLQNETIELREQLSLELDVDFVEAISKLTDRQASYEASLRASAITSRLTLLDFL